MIGSCTPLTCPMRKIALPVGSAEITLYTRFSKTMSLRRCVE